MRRPRPCFLTVRIHPVGRGEDSQAGTQPLTHPKEENAQPHGGREREVEGESRESEAPWARVARTPPLEGTSGCAGDHIPRSLGLFLGPEGCREGQVPTLPCRHQGAPKGLETPQLAGTCVPSKPKRGGPHATSGAGPPNTLSDGGALALSPDTPADITCTSPRGTACRSTPGSRHTHTQTRSRSHAHAH